MNQNNLPADPIAMVFGIMAILIGLAGCCCYGIVAIVPLILSIIGLYLANKSIREFNENPEAFSPQSRSNVGTAKVINIIAIVLNGLVFLLFIGFLVVYGTIFSAAILEGMQDSKNEEPYEWESDSIYFEEENIKTIETDSIYIDSVELKGKSKNN